MSNEQVIPPMPTEQPAPTPTPRPAWLVPAVTAMAGLAFGIGSTLAVQAVTAEEKPAKPKTFTLTGTVVIKGERTAVVQTASGNCGGVGGYNDLRTGASVTVYGKAGAIVSTGSLGASSPGSMSTTAAQQTCSFSVSVDGVPTGEGFYQVEVSHRGKISISEAEAVAGAFAASIGN
ncbi:hypothetical protein [Streptomyces sp. NBC_00158]|uniref:hypothetical protein n=1 Tax=Streptomyces sp. NBC_00158 TaxID=2903627 RepID=UPI002F9138EA